MGSSPTVALQCAKESLSAMPRQASEHSTEQAAGWLNSLADHPTAIG